ncbi:hypothetical protein ACKTEK_03990 [Tepidamorphus sp. 3E244]|uniref:hypothetical protein n=1 Tax=Tepidamorphus sp. 3E244 TaxID=3385498 RepID=UPI0038FC3F6B
MSSVSARVRAAIAVLPALFLSACDDPVDTTVLAEYLRSKVPTERARAAGHQFYSCDLDEDRGVCEDCAVTIHDRESGGLNGYATHWYHDMKKDADGWKRSSTGERAHIKLQSEEATADAVATMLDDAKDWCGLRGESEFHVLKQE